MPSKPQTTVTPAERPKRLSLSQIVEQLLTRSGERSSVSLIRNAKGETQIDVKVSTGAEGEAATVEDAERKAVAVYDRLRELYAPPTTRDDASIDLTRNAKGDTQIAVSLRTGDEGVATVDQAASRAREVYDAMREHYPTANGAA